MDLLRSRMQRYMKKLRTPDDGFSFAESLFSILFLLLLSAGVTALCYSVMKHSGKYISNMETGILVLRTDSRIRNMVGSMVLDYRRNNAADIEKLVSEIYMQDFSDGIRVLKVEKLYSEGRRVAGLDVYYEVKALGSVRNCAELFSGGGIL